MARLTLPPGVKARDVVERWALIALGMTLMGLLSSLIVITSWRAEGNPRPAKFAFMWEMSGVLTVLLFLPGLLWFMRRFRLSARNAWRLLPLHLGVFAAFAVCHTLSMWASRSVLYRLLGWGEYFYGDMRYRFLMEGGKQLVIYWAIYVIVTVVELAERSRQRELAAAQLARQLTDAKLQALKMQLNPHFLFNALNMISSHVEDDPVKAEAMLVHLSDFLRMTLRHTETQEVRLETELEFLNAYLEIMQARFEERLSVEVQADDQARACLVPHLVLQPLVENAIHHALDDGQARAWLRVSAARADARLRIAIEDNGPGLSGSAPERRGLGVGLTNTSERLRHLYGSDQRLALSERTGGGVRLELEVPYRRLEPA